MDIENNKLAIRYITYGDDQYAQYRELIAKEARDLDYFTHITVESTRTIKKYSEYQRAMKSPKFARVFNNEKGGGFWMWKPLIVYQELLRMKEDDLLFYSDSGCEIVSSDETICRLDHHVQCVQSAPSGFLAFCNPHAEHMWTKADIYKHFNTKVTDFSDRPGIYQIRQVTANRFVIRKTSASMKIVKTWWDTAKYHPGLFTDAPSVLPNCDEFISNKHDQSVLSVICKTCNASLDTEWENIAISRRRDK